MLAMPVVSAPGFEACMQPQMTRHSGRRSQVYMDLASAYRGSGFRGVGCYAQQFRAPIVRQTWLD